MTVIELHETRARDAFTALGAVVDPELDEPITDLGFVRSVVVQETPDGAAVEVSWVVEYDQQFDQGERPATGKERERHGWELRIKNDANINSEKILGSAHERFVCVA